jgi:hypothetical protein
MVVESGFSFWALLEPVLECGLLPVFFFSLYLFYFVLVEHLFSSAVAELGLLV